MYTKIESLKGKALHANAALFGVEQAKAGD